MVQPEEMDAEQVNGQVMEFPAEQESASYHDQHPNHGHHHGHSTNNDENGSGPSNQHRLQSTPFPNSLQKPSSSVQSPSPSNAAEQSTSRVRYEEQGINNSPSKSKFRARLTSAGSEANPNEPISTSTSNDFSSYNERLKRTSQLSLAPSVRTAGPNSSFHSRDGSRTHGQGSMRGSAKGSLRMKQKVSTTPAWARSENSTPTTSPQLRASTSQSGGAIPSLGGALGSVDNLSPSPNLPPSAASHHSEAEESDQPEHNSKGPERFWTFALPAQSSSRPWNQAAKVRSDDANGSANVPPSSPRLEEAGARKFRGVWSNLHYKDKEKDRSRERGNTSGSTNTAAATAAASPMLGMGKKDQEDSDQEVQAEEDADKTLSRRGSGDGMAGDKAALAAAGFGASNLMGRQRNRARGDSGDNHLQSKEKETESSISPGLERTGSGQEDAGPHRRTGKDGDDEDENEIEKGRIYQNDPFFGTGVMRARMPDQAYLSNSFTRHQPQTPGWESPWRPEERGGNSIEINGYRFGIDGHFGKNPNSHGYFPRTDTRSSKGLKKRRFGGRRVSASNGGAIMNEKGQKIDPNAGKSRIASFFTPRLGWKDYMLHDPFVPLLFRLLNLCITTSTLAVAIKVHLRLKALGDTGAVGSSPLLAIIFSPMTLVHVAVQVYMEYFGRPIGLWDTGSKLFYTLIEVLFIALWSAELGLTFDNYFTSPLICATFNTPFAGSRSVCVPNPDGTLTDGTVDYKDSPVKSSICRLQGALIGLTFVSLLAYTVVFTVSLFRIFVRVSGKRSS